MLSPGPQAGPTPGYGVFLTLLGRMLAKLLGERQHGELTISFKDGKVTLVRVQTSYLPTSLPQV